MSLIETVADIAVPQAALPLRLLSWAQGAATWLFAHPMTGVALLATVFGAVEHHEADKWAALARQRSATLAAMQSANTRATQQAIAVKEAKDVYTAKLAVQSDQAAADLRSRYHAAVLRLAAAESRARSADLPGHAAAAASSDGPRQGAVVLVGSLDITSGDALTCGDNTARLQAVHDWAEALGQ